MTADPTVFPTERLLDALEVAIVVFDVEGKILLANKRAVTTSGCSANHSTTRQVCSPAPSTSSTSAAWR